MADPLPDNLAHHRDALYRVSETLTYKPEDFLLYWPFINNVWRVVDTSLDRFNGWYCYCRCKTDAMRDRTKVVRLGQRKTKYSDRDCGGAMKVIYDHHAKQVLVHPQRPHWDDCSLDKMDQRKINHGLECIVESLLAMADSDIPEVYRIITRSEHKDKFAIAGGSFISRDRIRNRSRQRDLNAGTELVAFAEGGIDALFPGGTNKKRKLTPPPPPPRPPPSIGTLKFAPEPSQGANLVWKPDAVSRSTPLSQPHTAPQRPAHPNIPPYRASVPPGSSVIYIGPQGSINRSKPAHHAQAAHHGYPAPLSGTPQAHRTSPPSYQLCYEAPPPDPAQLYDAYGRPVYINPSAGQAIADAQAPGTVPLQRAPITSNPHPTPGSWRNVPPSHLAWAAGMIDPHRRTDTAASSGNHRQLQPRPPERPEQTTWLEYPDGRRTVPSSTLDQSVSNEHHRGRRSISAAHSVGGARGNAAGKENDNNNDAFPSWLKPINVVRHSSNDIPSALPSVSAGGLDAIAKQLQDELGPNHAEARTGRPEKRLMATKARVSESEVEIKSLTAVLGSMPDHRD